jgi:L-serine/L-threonine ammonia-lyase
VVAARQLGHPATVVVPLTTKQEMIEKIRSRGATDIIQHGASWREADTYLREVILAVDPCGVYVPPFDHEDIWEGNATLVHELFSQMKGGRKQVNGHANGDRLDAPPKAVICSVGGGGLFCGIMRGLARHPTWSNVVVVAAETVGADSLHRSVRAGELVTLPGITSRATSLGATRVAEECWAYAHEENVRSVTVTDDEAARACCFVADEDRLLVELACGASVAVCFDGALEEALGSPLKPTDSVVVVLCGGSNVSIDLLGQWKTQVSKPAVNGHTNGHANGHANGHTNGYA